MNRVLTAVFDGQTLQFEAPLDLEPNIRYRITIEPEPIEEPLGDAWDVLKRWAGTVEAPADWSLEHNHYIHGTPKRYSKNHE